MHKRIASFCSAALLCAGVGTAAIAHAQPTSSLSESSAPPTSEGAATQGAPAPAQAAPVPGTEPMAPAPGAGAGAQVSDEQLQKFVESAQKVAALSTEYNQRLQEAQGTESQQQIVAEANDRMASAVESSGLTVEEFNGISQAIEQDPQLHARAQQMLPQQPAPMQ